MVEPGAVFVLQLDECRYRCCPALRPRRGPPQRRRRGGAAAAEPGTASRLAFGCGHRSGADAASGHVLTLCANRDCHLANWLGRSIRRLLSLVFCQFFVRSGKGRSSSRRLRSASRSARKGSRDRNASGAWRRAALAELVFRSALAPEHAQGQWTAGRAFRSRTGRGWDAIMPPAAAPLSCARPSAACSSSAGLRASSRGSRRPAPAPAAGSSPHWGRCAPRGCVA
jgi:hypothetical protein